MIKAALEYLKESIISPEDRLVEHDGRYFSVNNNGVFGEIKPLRTETINLSTLDGFIDYVQKTIEDRDKDEFSIFIDNPTDLSLKETTCNDGLYFNIYANAQAKEYISAFKYNSYQDPERFAIALQTCFIQSEVRDQLIKVCSSMSRDAEHKIEDDGTTQATTVGRAVKTKVKIANPVMLRPIRTFQEVEQPESPFVFRINEDMECALFEADSGAWKLKAINSIYEYLKPRVKVTVYR